MSSEILNLPALEEAPGIYPIVNSQNSEVQRKTLTLNSAGDINGDGFDDVIINQSQDNAYIVFGKATTEPNPLDLASLDGENGFKIDKAIAGSVKVLGDINGDGFSDLGLGSQTVLLGQANGFPAILTSEDLNDSNSISITTADYSLLDFSLSAAGDFNGDGFDDFAVSSAVADYSYGSYNSFRSYIIYGNDEGLGDTINLDNLSENQGLKFESRQTPTPYYGGGSVTELDDIDGDGFDDLFFKVYSSSYGVTYSYNGYNEYGYFQVVDEYIVKGRNETSSEFIRPSTGTDIGILGLRTLLNLGDVNGDSANDFGGLIKTSRNEARVFLDAQIFDNPSQLRRLNGENGFTLKSPGTIHKISAAGDVNDDGLNDILINVNNNRFRPTGAEFQDAYIVFGRTTPYPNRVDLARLSPAEGFAFTLGEDSLNGVSEAIGDFNGDQISDVIVGLSSSQSYIVQGRSTQFPLETKDIIVFNTVGDGQNNSLIGGIGNDTLSGRGGRDFLSGGEGNDSLKGGEGNDRLRGDRGNDTLRGGSGNDLLVGQAGNDLLVGGKGDDILAGGGGQDTLSGRAGRDRFKFLQPGPADTITDFESGVDQLLFSQNGFSGNLSRGILQDHQFILGGRATSTDHRFIYNSRGRLFFDADGSGVGKAKLVSIHSNQASLQASDIKIA